MMGKEKKKQHFVPRSYLERWAIHGKYQVYVYNKQQKKPYLASIYDVASERYFYDIDFTGIFSEDDLRKLGFRNVIQSMLMMNNTLRTSLPMKWKMISKFDSARLLTESIK